MKDHTDLLVKLIVLEEEVEHYKTLLMPCDTGHIHTTINFLQSRIPAPVISLSCFNSSRSNDI